MGDARLDQRPKQVQKESFLTANTPWKAIAMYLLTSSLTVLEEARLYYSEGTVAQWFLNDFRFLA